MSKHYNKHVRGVNRTTGMLIGEVTGYGVAGKIAGLDTTGIGNKALGVGSSLAGMPSLMSGAKNVMDSTKMLYQKKRRKK